MPKSSGRADLHAVPDVSCTLRLGCSWVELRQKPVPKLLPLLPGRVVSGIPRTGVLVYGFLFDRKELSRAEHWARSQRTQPCGLRDFTSRASLSSLNTGRTITRWCLHKGRGCNSLWTLKLCDKKERSCCVSARPPDLNNYKYLISPDLHPAAKSPFMLAFFLFLYRSGVDPVLR